MKRNRATPEVMGRVWSLAIALMLMLSVSPVFVSPVAAQGSVTLTINTTSADAVTPMPFVRVRATSSDGTVYGPREIGLQGTTSFDIDVTSPEMTVTVDVETAPACGIPPEPQVIGPFAGGEAPVVNFAIATDGNCNLGTLAVYAYDCPSGFDASATAYETWRDGCTEARNNVPFTFTMVSTNQTWNPVTGQWGISARAPIVGLPPGAYTMQESNPAPDQDSVFYCYNYATPDYVTSPNPTSIDRVEAPGGVATVNLNNNRISCDVFQVDAPEEPQVEPTATDDDGGGAIIEPPAVVGQATTTDELNLRSGPGSDAAILLQMPAGAVVDVLGDQQNGFYPVRYQGQDGWAGAQFLSFDGAASTATDAAAVEPAEPSATATNQAVSPIQPVEPVGSATTTSDVNLRDAPTATGSNVIAVLPGGTQVDLLGEPENGFYPVRYNDQNGWISGDFLSIDGEGGEDPTATATITTTATSEVLPTSTAVEVPNPESPLGTAVTNDSVNFRNGPSSDAAVLFELPFGATVDILGDSLNGFFPVRYQNQSGWVSGIFLDIQEPTATATSTSTAEPTGTTAPIGIAFTTSDVNMRVAPDATSDVLTVLLPNTQVDVLGPEINGFLPIRYNGQDGFASSEFLSIGAPQAPTATATIGAASEDPATLELHKSVCPAGYVPGDSIFDDCHEDGLDNVTFTVEGPDDFSTSDVTARIDGAGPGIVVFGDLAPATYTVFEDVPGDFTSISVHCSLAESDEVVAFTSNDAVQGIDIALTAGQSVVCDWYNIPDDQGTGSIELHKALCDPGYAPGPGIYDECHGQGLAGVEFSIAGPNDFSDQTSTVITQSPGPGIATFEGLFAGTFTITEDYIGEGIGIAVFCSMADSDEIVPFTYTQDGGIEVTLVAGQQIICDWYNTQEEADAGTVIVHKRTCPVGYDDEAASFDDFYADCLTRTDDVTFTLTPDGGSPMNRDTGDDGSGRAVFSGLGTGEFTLGEDLPGEFVNRYAYCGPDDRNLSATPIVNGDVQLELTAENPDAVCLWFNSPEDLSGLTGQISLTKFVCPAGTSSNYWEKCSPTPLQGATFVLDGPGEVGGNAVTPANGNVVFGDLPAGNYTIQEIPPSGVNVAVYVVACQAGGAAYKFTYDDSNGMKIKLNLPVAGEIHCNWYNVRKTTPVQPPPVTGGKGTITVHKFVCTGKAVSQYDWENDCLIQTSPEGFAISNLAGTRLAQGTTSTNGIITFTGLANGTYKLDETTGDWCHAEADYVDAAGNLIVKNSGNTNVYIYNCGARQVGTLPTTGSGDTALGNATANLFMPAAGALVTLIVLFSLSLKRRKPVRRTA